MKSNYKLVTIIIFCIVGTIIYSNSFQNSFHLDDYGSIEGNSAIEDITNLGAIWNFWPTRFVTYSTIAFNYHLNRLHVWGYHLFNLIIHLGVTILVWLFTLLTFFTPRLKDKKITNYAHPIAFFVGLIFLTHPVQTQGVTYIIQRTTSLATFFYLAALSLYVKFRLLQLEGVTLKTGKFYYISSLIIAIWAMFTKEMTITLPLMVLLYEFCFLKTKKNFPWKYIIPFLLTLLIIPLTMLFTKSVDFIEMKRVTERPILISPFHYLLTQFRVMVTYLRLVFIPLNQNLDYDYPIAKSLIETPTLISLFFLVLILIFAIKIFHRYRLTSFAILWFFLTLLPESSIIPIRDVIFEHRLYLPIAGYSFFLVSSIFFLLEGKISLRTISAILIVIVMNYAILTYQRNIILKDEFSLWNDTIQKSPKKARPYVNRGIAYQTQGKFSQAIIDYNQAIQIDPQDVKVYISRGLSYQNQGNLTQALADYNLAIQIDPKVLDEILYNNRGIIYQIQGNLTQAISDYTKSIQLNPRLTQAYNNRGLAYQEQGNLTQSILDYNQAIQIDPKNVRAYKNRAYAYFLKHEYDKSWQDVEKAESLGGKVNSEFLTGLQKASHKFPSNH